MPTQFRLPAPGRAPLAAVVLFAFAVIAARPQNAVIVASVPGYPGGTVPVPVHLRQTISNSVVAAQFDVAYNSTKLSGQTARLGARLPNHVIRSRRVAPGVERVLIYSLNNAPMNGTNLPMAEIPFQVSPAEYVGTGALTPTGVELARADGTPLSPVTKRAGTVFVRPVNPLPDGTVQFFIKATNDVRYIIDATTNLVHWKSILTNDATGNFMDLVDPDPAEFPYRFYRARPLP